MSGERLSDLVGRWTAWCSRHAAAVIVAAVLGTAVAGPWASRHLAVDSDTGRMISERVPWRRAFLAYEREFPQLGDEIQVVIEAGTPEAAEEAQRALGRRLARRPDQFRNVYLPRGGPFFERNGLLYLEASELEELARQVERFQRPLLELEAEPSIGVLTGVIIRDLSGRSSASEDSTHSGFAAPLAAAIGRSFRDQISWRTPRLSWRSLLAGDSVKPADRRRFIVLNPALDYSRSLPAGPAIESLRTLIGEVIARAPPGVEIHVTGSEAIEHEALESAVSSTRKTGLLALILVGLVLYVGLASARLVAASLITLAAGLIWTSAFAAAAVGRLNMISIAFAVIYIGLGIDYAVHLCLGIVEALAERGTYAEALQLSARRVGSSLVLSALTTAACFYAFVPTDFSGVSELGLIGGTGMLISLFATLTLLPALLAVRPFRPARRLGGEEHPGRAGSRAGSFLNERISVGRRPIIAISAVLVALSAGFASRVSFDQDPMNLSDPNSESVRTYWTLRDDPNTVPMTVSVLAPDADSAVALASRLRELPSVRDVVTPLDLLPEQQQTKLALIREIRIGPPAAPPARARVGPPGARVEQALQAAGELSEALSMHAVHAAGDSAAAARGLSELLRIWRFWLGLWQPPMQARLAEELEYGLVGSVPWDVRRLRAGLAAEPIDLSDLPPVVRDRWIGRQGSWRVQVLPAADLSSSTELARFVDGVRAVVPDVTGIPVNDLESARVAVSAFWRAFALALVSITVLLCLLYRSPRRVALILGPLLAAGAMTFGFAGAVGLRMNFANIITLPLLLGVGVDNAIHVVHRMRTAPGTHTTFYDTSTARAILVATLTTLVSFGSLALSSHRGLASMGQLLAVGMVALLFTTLILLPAILSSRQRSPPAA